MEEEIKVMPRKLSNAELTLLQKDFDRSGEVWEKSLENLYKDGLISKNFWLAQTSIIHLFFTGLFEELERSREG